MYNRYKIKYSFIDIILTYFMLRLHQNKFNNVVRHFLIIIDTCKEVWGSYIHNKIQWTLKQFMKTINDNINLNLWYNPVKYMNNMMTIFEIKCNVSNFLTIFSNFIQIQIQDQTYIKYKFSTHMTKNTFRSFTD